MIVDKDLTLAMKTERQVELDRTEEKRRERMNTFQIFIHEIGASRESGDKQ